MSDVKVNLSDWKIDKSEAIYCAIGYIIFYVNTNPEKAAEFKNKVGPERFERLTSFLQKKLSDKDNFNPLLNGWDMADMLMALQDELEKEVAAKH